MNATAEQQNQTEQNQCLTRIIKGLHHPQDFSHTLEEIEQDILQLFSAERLTVYQYKIADKALVSRYKTGEELKEIHLKLGMLSIAGFVGMTQKPVQISNVYNSLELRRINPGLMFDHRFDKATGFHTKSMMVIPIEKNGSLLGVLQLMNKQNGPYFSEEDIALAIQLTALIGQKFGHIIKITNSPFEHLVNQKLIKASKLNTYLKQSNSLDQQVALILKHTKLTIEQIGESLEYYFQVPYLPYQPDKYWLHPLAENLNHGLFKKSRFIILTDQDDSVIVLIEDPKNITRRREIQNVIGQKECTLHVGLISDITRYLEPSVSVSEDETEQTVLTLNDTTNLENLPETRLPASDDKPELIEEDIPKKASVLRLSENDLLINDFSGLSKDLTVEEDPTEQAPANKPAVELEGKLISSDDFTINKQSEHQGIRPSKELITQNAPVNKDAASDRLVNRILADAQRAKATDVYIEPKHDKRIVQIRMRANGVCTALLDIPAKLALKVIARIKVMAKLESSQNNTIQTGVFSIRLYDQDQDVAVNILPTTDGESLVMHLTAFNAALVRTNFNLSPTNEEALKAILRYQKGLFLIIGATSFAENGSIYQILDALNKPNKKSWVVSKTATTIHSDIPQINKDSTEKLHAATVLRSLSKTACDTVFIDGLETKEDLTQAFQVASTSLVLATMEAETLAGIIPYLLIMEIKPLIISTTLLGVINQREVATLCSKCKQVRNAKPGETELIMGLYGEHAENDLGSTSDFLFYEPIGCDVCNHTGYAGHTSLCEVFSVDEPSIMKLMKTHPLKDDVKEYLSKRGTRNLLQDGLQKVVKGEIDLIEVQKSNKIKPI